MIIRKEAWVFADELPNVSDRKLKQREYSNS